MRVKILCPDRVHYVRVRPDGTMDAKAKAANAWEVFDLKDEGSGRISLKSLHIGKFVRAVAGGGSDLKADRDVAYGHELFTTQPLTNGKVAIVSHNGNFWRAFQMGGSQLDCLATQADAWEAFEIAQLLSIISLARRWANGGPITFNPSSPRATGAIGDAPSEKPLPPSQPGSQHPRCHAPLFIFWGRHSAVAAC